MHLLHWLGERDRDYLALRRAGRAAIVVPTMFALGEQVIGNAALATFAAFGSFAMLLLVDFTGPMRDRLQAQAALAVVGAVLVCLGTLASRTAWLAAVAMAVVAFAVLFAGVVSSVLASAAPALLLAFILPVSLPGSVSAIPDRLAGWALASVAAFLAVAVLWPAPARDPLRGPAAAACRALAVRLRADAAYVRGGPGAPAESERAAAVAAADTAIGRLHQVFLASPNRPTGLSTSAHTVVRLVDELNWVGLVVASGPRMHSGPVNRSALAVKSAAAAVLDSGADLLDVTGGDPRAMHVVQARLTAAVAELEAAPAVPLPAHHATRDPASGDEENLVSEVVSALDPTFRAQELGFAVSQIAGNIDLTAAAERRSWPDRLLGRQPAGLSGTLSAAHERAAAHLERHSVWLHNSLRGALALGLAVLVANLSGVQHSFWVVLGTLSVLRSNALSTGQNVLKGLLGTAAGFLVAAVLLVPIGSHKTVLWLLLPPAVLLAGVAPAAISFTAGQAAFTLTVVILFNIIAPAGWRVGLLRIEDVGLGCAVSLVVGLLFWPRGAAGALGRTLAEAYVECARYLAKAVAFAVVRCNAVPAGASRLPPPTGEAARAAAASRRLDDAFRSYLAERGPKPGSLADVTGLVNGVVGVRLVADAVLDLWDREDGEAEGDRAAAGRELLAATGVVTGWYDDLAAGLVDAAEPPQPLGPDALGSHRLVATLRRDLLAGDGSTTATAARMIWTGEYLDAVRRLQAVLVVPARAAGDQRALTPPRGAQLWQAIRPSTAR